MAVTMSALSSEQIEAWRHRIRSTTFANHHYEMGVALLRSGEPDHAAAAFRRALDTQADLHAAAFELEELLTKLGRTYEARTVSDAARRAEPDYRVIGACRRIATLLDEERFDEAGSALNALTGADRTHPALTLAQAILLLHANQTIEAGGLLEGLLTTPVPHADVFVNALGAVARVLSQRAQDADAVRVLDILLALTPDDEQGRLHRARLAQAQGDHDRVLALMEPLELFSSPIIAHQYRFLALLGLGRVGEAHQALGAAERLAPGHGVLLAFRALAELAQGHVAEAEAAAMAARKALDGTVWVQVASALVFLAQGRIAEADKQIASAALADGNALHALLARIGRLAEPVRARLTALRTPNT
jgi:tetratricopeptide (TPR) repeat protein